MEKLKEGWRRVKLGNFCSVKGGKRLPKGESLQIIPNKHPYIRIKDLVETKNLKLTSNFEFVPDKIQEKIGRYIVSENDIIISIVGTIGLINKIDKTLHNGNLTENCVKLINLLNISSDFLYYYLKSEYGQFEIKKGIVGAVQQKLPIKNIQNIEISLPPLETQEKIASILSALDDKIEINNEMNKTLEEMAQTLFKRWFIDFDFPNENGEPYRSSGGKMVDSELGEIPEGWEVTKIENVVNIKRGASPRPIQDFVSDNGIPWIKISDATSSISKFLNKTNEFIIEKGKEKSRFIERGTLILSNSAIPGIPMIVNLDACVHDGWLIFNEYKNITREFLYYVLKYHKENILALSNGSVFRNLKTDILKNYKIILPNLDLIILFNKNLEIIDKYIRNNVEEIQSLTEIRDTLLPKLMSGEIEV